MERHETQLALAAQAPLTGATARDYAAQLRDEIRAKLSALGYTRETGRAWLVRQLQVEEWLPGLLEMAEESHLSVLLDRLITEQEGRAMEFNHVSHDDFWRLQRALGVSRQTAMGIVSAFTADRVTDWPGAYEDSQRRFGASVAA